MSQARPKRAIAETMPALNTVIVGISETLGRDTTRMSVPTTNMTISMIGVIATGSPAASSGRRPLKRPKATIAATPSKKITAALRPAAVTVTSARTSAAFAEGAGISPFAIFAWISGSSAISLPRRFTTMPEMMMPTIAAGIVTFRMSTSSKFQGAVSVRVTMAAIAAETGLQASATPVATTDSESGREGRTPLR